MSQSPEQSQIEIAKLRKRLNRLETRVSMDAEAARRSRLTTGGLAGGAVALFLSLSLPWVEASFTGWEFLWDSIGERRWLVVVALIAVLVTLVFAVASLSAQGRGVLVAAQIAGWSVPALLAVGAIYLSIEDVSLVGGVWVAAVSGAVVAGAARGAAVAHAELE
ncbi:hypothetical protein [Nocardiopsis lucentensis]|uniref:hypothetical protein n=1 Tax=Nocardiopsis lucentensis TaxID=53441 RepID=UPI000345765C|nr:hypothetical protein [Nocardiopsis lucentensis]